MDLKALAGGLVGGIGGFLVGGPVGAVAGATAGAAVVKGAEKVFSSETGGKVGGATLGGVVGAALGGPVGAVIGGALGSKIGGAIGGRNEMQNMLSQYGQNLNGGFASQFPYMGGGLGFGNYDVFGGNGNFGGLFTANTGDRLFGGEAFRIGTSGDDIFRMQGGFGSDRL
jgi:hypothetical protein